MRPILYALTCVLLASSAAQAQSREHLEKELSKKSDQLKALQVEIDALRSKLNASDRRIKRSQIFESAPAALLKSRYEGNRDYRPFTPATVPHPDSQVTSNRGATGRLAFDFSDPVTRATQPANAHYRREWIDGVLYHIFRVPAEVFDGE